MPRRNDRVSLRHMLDHAVEAVELTSGKTREDLGKEDLPILIRLLQDALQSDSEAG